MPHSLRCALLGAAIAALLAGPATAAAREWFDPTLPVPIVEPATSVRAGETLRFHWSAMRCQVKEFELLLSIDGGRTFRLRVSPDLEREERSYVWRVPNLDVADARVRIRARIDGREIEGPVSAGFAIVADAERPRERWLYHDRGWWEESEPGRHRSSSFAGSSGGAQLSAGPVALPLDSPPRFSIAPASLRPAFRTPVAAPAEQVPPAPPEPRLSRSCPMRE